MTSTLDAYWDEAFALLCQVEGVRLKPYQDQGGVWTIGVGTISVDGKPVTASTPPITMERAEELCRIKIDEFDKDITKDVRVPLTVGQRSALLSFVYNLGDGNFRSSRLLTLLNSGNYGSRQKDGTCTGAAGEFPKWNNVRIKGVLTPSIGLSRRRKLEQSVFLGEYAPSGSVSGLQSTAIPVNVTAPKKAPTVDLDQQEKEETDRLNQEQIDRH